MAESASAVLRNDLPDDGQISVRGQGWKAHPRLTLLERDPARCGAVSPWPSCLAVLVFFSCSKFVDARHFRRA